MKIFLICSKHCYTRIDSIVNELKQLGHIISFPNCFTNPTEEDNHRTTEKEHRDWKSKMFIESAKHIVHNDAVLVLNLTVEGRPENYIGGATMLEMYEAFINYKKVFVYNPLPQCSYTDELNGLVTEIIHGDLSKIN